MRYFLDLFTPETWSQFQAHGANISGFRPRQQKAADRVQPGDIFLCYLVRLSRWCGVLEVTSTHSTTLPQFFRTPTLLLFGSRLSRAFYSNQKIPFRW